MWALPHSHAFLCLCLDDNQNTNHNKVIKKQPHEEILGYKDYMNRKFISQGGSGVDTIRQFKKLGLRELGRLLSHFLLLPLQSQASLNLFCPFVPALSATLNTFPSLQHPSAKVYFLHKTFSDSSRIHFSIMKF